MKRYITLLLTVLCALSSVMLAGVRDLPVKKSGGKEYYYYKVQKGESVAGIAKYLGITPEEIIFHNRRAAGGVDKKTTLYFPVEAYAEPVAEEELTEEVDSATVTPALRPAIVVALPFGLDNQTPTRANRLALDFYRGFLLAADTLSRRGTAVEIVAIDTEAVDFAEQISTPAVATAQVVVAPADETQMATLASLAADRGTWVLNVLNVPDTLYATNPRVLQANVPQRNMYALAADAFMEGYSAYTPVILRSTCGKNEKEPFVSYLTERLSTAETVPVEITYDENLLSSHLDRLTPGERYVFVPTSGAVAEFNKFAYVLKSWRDRLAAEAATEGTTPTDVAIFGYPDWTVFRGDALDMLHRLEARVYSRFFDNFNSFDARTLESSFMHWYGEEILESVPSQAILGYDTGCFLIKNLRANNGEFNPVYPARYQGIQSTFDFDRSDDGGYYNSTLYIINYLPGDGISSHTL